MIGNITNALNFELKSASVKNKQIAELEMQVENARIRSQNAIEENEMNLVGMRQEIEDQCEQKVNRFRDLSMELEKVNKDLIGKAESLSRTNKSLEAKLHEKDYRQQHLESQLEVLNNQIQAYKANFPIALVKIHELAGQKRLLTRMLDKANHNLTKAREYVKKLLPRHQPKSILKNTKKGSKKKDDQNNLYYEQHDSDDETHANSIDTTPGGHLSYESTCLKLRRSVIMIIACNRLRKATNRSSAKTHSS